MPEYTRPSAISRTLSFGILRPSEITSTNSEYDSSTIDWKISRSSGLISRKSVSISLYLPLFMTTCPMPYLSAASAKLLSWKMTP